MMVLLFIIFLFSIPVIEGSQDYITEDPFYLRARVHDSHTASVQFEIGTEQTQRTCKLYKFTIRRDQEDPYSMPEQNLTFWRNSLELKHLPSGKYRICAIICSEHLRHVKYHYAEYKIQNRSIPIKACIEFQAYRTHRLILMLYILALIFLIFSHMMYSLRKRQFQARVKLALIELEKAIQRRHTTETPAILAETSQSYSILQSLVTLPASPAVHSDDDDEHNPVIFHLEIPNEH